LRRRLAVFYSGVDIGHFLLEIALRAFLSMSTYTLVEFVSYAMAAMTCLALGHALEQGGLIRVSLLIQYLDQRAPPLRHGLEILCGLLAFGAVAFVTHALWNSALRNHALGITSYTNMRTPLWIPEAIVITGLVILEIQLLAHVLRSAFRLSASRSG
jgi:TRAP-type mannitol/chloroaromatic compound transport system permease small subunit